MYRKNTKHNWVVGKERWTRERKWRKGEEVLRLSLEGLLS